MLDSENVGVTMRLNVYAAGFCAAAIAIAACTSAAGAASKEKEVASNHAGTAATLRPGTRIRVERRSFLDAGTHVAPGERKFMDYAVPPYYSPLGEALGPGKDFRRQPLLDPWDFPGAWKSW